METLKTHWKKLTDPNYLGAYDFQPNEKRVVTIKEVTQSTVKGQDGKEEDCIKCQFTEGKPMILNVTNCKAIAKAHGTNFIEDWNGLKVTLFVQNVSAFGSNVEALRIEQTAPKGKPVLSDARLIKAIEAIKAGKITKDSVLNDYKLSDSQLLKLDESC